MFNKRAYLTYVSKNALNTAQNGTQLVCHAFHHRTLFSHFSRLPKTLFAVQETVPLYKFVNLFCERGLLPGGVYPARFMYSCIHSRIDQPKHLWKLSDFHFLEIVNSIRFIWNFRLRLANYQEISLLPTMNITATYVIHKWKYLIGPLVYSPVFVV